MTDTTASSPTVSAAEVARTLHLNKATIGRWIAKGRIQAERTEWGYQIPVGELNRLLAEKKLREGHRAENTNGAA